MTVYSSLSDLDRSAVHVSSLWCEVCVFFGAPLTRSRQWCDRSGLDLSDCQSGTPSYTCPISSIRRYRDPPCGRPWHTAERTLRWQLSQVPHLHHTGNKPACLRQPARIDSGCGNVQSPLRAGYLLFGASFFSYRDSELRLGYVDHLIVELSLDFRL